MSGYAKLRVGMSPTSPTLRVPTQNNNSVTLFENNAGTEPGLAAVEKIHGGRGSSPNRIENETAFQFSLPLTTAKNTINKILRQLKLRGCFHSFPTPNTTSLQVQLELGLLFDTIPSR